MENTADAAKRLWNLCNVLRDDGITYHQYISELTLILFFKLASQLGVEADIPAQYRWSSLLTLSGSDLLSTFKESIKYLGDSPNNTIREMFAENQTSLRNPRSLQKILYGIDGIRWSEIASSSIGEMYESLIGRNAQESRYGAGQYFTPRALVEAIVKVHNPDPADSVYDPAAGTAGFLVVAGIQSRENFGEQCDLYGNELVHEVQRMAQMNLHLHNLRAELQNRDTLLRPLGDKQYSLCLTNPPFGIRGDSDPQLQDGLIFPTSNKQLAFLQHIFSCLEDNGRAAVIIPDNVLFEAGTAAAVRTYILDNFNLHTMLRLPPGIFYATGVKTSVLFFSRTRPTRDIWVYDLRLADQSFTRKHPISAPDLEEFVECYRQSEPTKRCETERFTRHSRHELRYLEDRLDLLGAPAGASQQNSAKATLGTIARELDQAATAVKALQALLDKAGTLD
jgi:type I restriction enzyme M protein